MPHGREEKAWRWAEIRYHAADKTRATTDLLTLSRCHHTAQTHAVTYSQSTHKHQLFEITSKGARRPPGAGGLSLFPPLAAKDPGSSTNAQVLFPQRSKSGSRTADLSSRRCGKAVKSPRSSTLGPALRHLVPPRPSRRRPPGTSARRSGWGAAEARAAEAVARAAPAPALAARPRPFWETTHGTTRPRAPPLTCRPPRRFCTPRRPRSRTTITTTTITAGGAPR
jgi:hypothetical protein